MRRLLSVLLFFFMMQPAMAQYPELRYYVTDQVGVLLTDEIYDIESVCSEIYKRTGAEMAILIVNDTQPDGIDLFAVRTFEATGLGQEGKDNGLLILISFSESLWRVEVGYGLEGVLSDARVNRLAMEGFVPYLNSSMYYEGIYNLTLAIGQIIVDEYEGEPPKVKEPWYPIPCLPLLWWQLLIVVVIFVAVSVLTKGRVFLFPFWIFGGRGGGGFGGGRSGGGGARGRF